MENRKKLIKGLALADLGLLGWNLSKGFLLGGKIVMGLFVPNYFPASVVLLIFTYAYCEVKNGKNKEEERKNKNKYNDDEIFYFED